MLSILVAPILCICPTLIILILICILLYEWASCSFMLMLWKFMCYRMIVCATVKSALEAWPFKMKRWILTSVKCRHFTVDGWMSCTNCLVLQEIQWPFMSRRPSAGSSEILHADIIDLCVYEEPPEPTKGKIFKTVLRYPTHIVAYNL